MFKNISINKPHEILLTKITDEEYFSAIYKDYISNSRLSLVDPANMQTFFDSSSSSTKYSDSLFFGSLIHGLVLQPGYYHLVSTIDRPTAKLGFVADLMYNDYISNLDLYESYVRSATSVGYYVNRINEKTFKTICDSCLPYWKARKEYEQVEHSSTPLYCSPQERNKIGECLHSLSINREIQQLLSPSGIFDTPIIGNELALLAKLNITFPDDTVEFKFKSKLDNFTVDLDSGIITINDLKTTGRPINDFEESFQTFNYSRELAIYSWLLLLYYTNLYNKNFTIKTNCLVVSTVPPYNTRVYKVKTKEIYEGWNSFKDLLTKVAYSYHYEHFNFN